MSDVLAFIQKGIDEGRTEEPNRIICLNSTSNVPKLVEHLQDFKGKMYLCLDADQAGEKQRKTFNSSFKRHRFTRTLRHFEGRGGSKDFNEVLMKEKGLIQEQKRGPKEGGNLKTKVSNCMFPLFFLMSKNRAVKKKKRNNVIHLVINELYKILLYVGDNVIIVRGRQCYCTWRTITTKKKDHKNQNKTSFFKN